MPAPDTRTPGDVVRVRALEVDYRTAGAATPALVGVDLDAPEARLTVVAGPSGSGKSTLLRVLAGLHRPKAGRVVVGGVDLSRLRTGALRRHRRRALGVVLQRPADNLLEELTALEQVELGARLRGAPTAGALDLLATVGLAERAASPIAALSGGEQQRVGFAAAAVGTPVVVLADEPTAQLDATSGTLLIAGLRHLVDAGTTLVVSSHDPAVIDAADHLIRLRDGRVQA